MTIIYRGNEELRTDVLAHYLPGGCLFEAKFFPESQMRALLKAIARENQNIDTLLIDIMDQHSPDKTINFIDNWERVVGIPDSCFKGTGPIAERITHVLIKLYFQQVVTKQDWIDLAKLLGFDITITSPDTGLGFAYDFPIELGSPSKERASTIIINVQDTANTGNFVYEFPFSFGPPSNQLLECLFEKIKPAHVKIEYNYV
jgi:uncharacterized protein YmfQ (DUF2313 family)